MAIVSFLTSHKQEFDFQQVGGLVTRNISFLLLFIASGAILQRPVDFYKGILLQVIPACFIVPCSKSMSNKIHVKE